MSGGKLLDEDVRVARGSFPEWHPIGTAADDLGRD
jgi:hypothetical protein